MYTHEQVGIFRGDYHIIGALGFIHSFFLLAKESRATENGKYSYDYEPIAALHGLATKKDSNQNIATKKLNDWFGGRAIKNLINIPKGTIIQGEFDSPTAQSDSLKVGTKVIKGILILPDERCWRGEFEITSNIAVTESFESFDAAENSACPKQYKTLVDAAITKLLPIDPNYKVPEVLPIGKSDYLQLYFIKFPHSNNSPFHSSSQFTQQNFFHPKDDPAYQFGGYWLPPTQHTRQDRLTMLYMKDDVLEKWNILSHPKLLKAFNDRHVPYSYLGAGFMPIYPTLNSNSVCSWLYQLLQGQPQEFKDVPSGFFSSNHWARIGMYNNPITDLDAKYFIAHIEKTPALRELALSLLVTHVRKIINESIKDFALRDLAFTLLNTHIENTFSKIKTTPKLCELMLALFISKIKNNTRFNALTTILEEWSKKDFTATSNDIVVMSDQANAIGPKPISMS